MAKVKKTQISITKIDEYLNGNIESAKDLEIKRSISLEDMVSFVNDVSNGVFIDGEYIPALKYAMYAKALMGYFTNIKIDNLSNDKLMALMYDRNFVSFIEGSMNTQLMLDIDEAIDNAIAYKIDLQKNELKKIEKHMSDFMVTMDAFGAQMKDINMSDFVNNLQSLANKDEKAIVDAVTNKLPNNVVKLKK